MNERKLEEGEYAVRCSYDDSVTTARFGKGTAFWAYHRLLSAGLTHRCERHDLLKWDGKEWQPVDIREAHK